MYSDFAPLAARGFLFDYSDMAVIGGLDIPDELIRLFRDLVRVINNHAYGAAGFNGHLLTREQKLNVATRSLLPQIGALWNGLTTEEKDAWAAAAEQSSYSRWNLFVQDTAYRLKFDLPGLATPSLFHQYKVGRLEVNSPAFGMRIAQYHPAFYYKQQKVRGTKGLYTDVKITEKLLLPLEIGLSWRSNLTPQTDNAVAEFYAEIISSYQGRDIVTKIPLNLGMSSGWQRDTVVCSEVVGVARSYNLFISLVDVRGWIEFDNVLAKHTGTNYARDFRCVDINNELSRVNYQIEKSWEEEFLPTGAAFDSVYPEDD